MQVETESSMKSQVTGVRKSSEEAESCNVRHKRIKLSHSPDEDPGDQEEILHDTSSLKNYIHFSNEINGSNDDLNAEETMHINNQDNGTVQASFINGSINNCDRSMTAEYVNNGIDDEQDTIIDVGDNYESELQSESTDANITDMKENEMESVNHEMRSVNHEMQSVNHEMQSVNHEMQSVNHEMQSANQEMQSDTDVRENYMSINNDFENNNHSLCSSKILEHNESEGLKDSRDNSNTSPPKNFPNLMPNAHDLPNVPETFLMSSPPRNSNDSTQKKVTVTIQSFSLNEDTMIPPENTSSNISEEIFPCIPEKDSKKETDESPWKAFVEHINSIEGNSETTQNDIVSFTPSNQADNTELEQSEVNSIEVSKKEDIKYLGIYDLKTTHLNGHADVILCVAASEDLVLSSSGDTTVKVFNVEEQRVISNFAGHSDAVTALIFLTSAQAKALGSKLAFPKDSTFAITASLDCHIKLWSVSDGKEILSVYTFNSITCMDYLSSEFSVVIGTDGGKLEVWDLIAAKKIESVFAHESSISSLKVNDCYVYSTSTDGAVKVWLFDDGEELQPLYSRRRRETSSTGTDLGPTHWKAIAFCNDMLFLGDTTPYLKALNWRIGRLTLFKNQLERAGICDAVFVQDNILLTTFYNATQDMAGINVWSLPDITYVGTLTGDVQDIYCLTMTQSEDKLRIVSGGHQLIVWDFNLKEPSRQSSSDSLYVCEIDGLGAEVNETNVRSPSSSIRNSSISISPSKMAVEKKQNSCNII